MDDSGDRYIKIVESSDGSRHDHSLKEGEVANIHNILFAANNPIAGAVNIRSDSGLHYITSPFDGTYLRMADQRPVHFRRMSTGITVAHYTILRGFSS